MEWDIAPLRIHPPSLSTKKSRLGNKIEAAYKDRRTVLQEF
jgi:hypothetical protein